MDPIVQIENVNFSYLNSPILWNVNFEIHPGEFVGIIGPNGGGKTTLLKLIMGFLRPNTGAIKVFGKSPKTAVQKLAYVPQSVRFDRQFPISVMEVVLSGRLSRLPWYGIFSQADKMAAHQALEMVGLLNFQDHAFGTLSGGQSQRTLIARALVSNPSLLILDEPTASVDAQAEGDIFSLLKELKEKMTILMVTHNLKVALDKVVDRVLCVQGNVTSLRTDEVCEHFALGLYHTPLVDVKHDLIF